MVQAVGAPVDRVRLRAAWEHALYGPAGFYRTQRPRDHFRTSAQVGRTLAEAVLALARERDLPTVWDIGAGGGELAAALVTAEPALRVCCVELAPRPVALPGSVDWLHELPDSLSGVVVAAELLDNVPCDVVERDANGAVRFVEVDPSTGAESLGGPVAPDVTRWLRDWWPLTAAGSRAEVGLAREELWASICDRTTAGICVAIDYGHLRADRPVRGTLASYRLGRRTDVAYDGDHDITAHVAFDALQHRVGGTLARQRDVLRSLTPDRDSSAPPGAEPADRLRELASRGQTGETTRAAGLGSHWWLLTDRPHSVP